MPRTGRRATVEAWADRGRRSSDVRPVGPLIVVDALAALLVADLSIAEVFNHPHPSPGWTPAS
jgi:hypothetical protein